MLTQDLLVRLTLLLNNKVNIGYEVKKIRIEQRISMWTEIITNGSLNISQQCVKTFEELGLIAYDEKAEDDKVKLIKQNDHTWDAATYALTPYFSRFTDY